MVRQSKSDKSEIREHLREILGFKITSIANINEFENQFGVYFPEDEIKKMTFNRLIAWQLAMMAGRGEQRAIQEILDRTVGKPKQADKNSGKNMDLAELIQMWDDEDGQSAGAGQNDTPEIQPQQQAQQDSTSDLLDDLDLASLGLNDELLT